MENWKDSDFVHSNYPSTWKQTRNTFVRSVQTETIKLVDREMQSTTLASVEVQTNEEPTVQVKNDPYPPSLYAFFSKVTEPICECLVENLDPLTSQTFSDMNEEGKCVEATKLHTLCNTNKPKEFEGSSIAWSKTGSQIAVGYGAQSHEGWCRHQTPLSIWNIDRSHNFNANVPHTEVFLDSCICCMEFHPTDSSILLVGLYSGEIVIVDIIAASSRTSIEVDVKEPDSKSNTNGQPSSEQHGRHAVSCIDGSAHVMPLTSVRWLKFTQSEAKDLFLKNRQHSTHGIISSSTDGYISLWSLNKTHSKLYLEKRFLVWSENIPENVQVGNRFVTGMKELGVTRLSPCKDDSSIFVCSTFGGIILQGNVTSSVEIYGLQDTLSSSTNKEPVFEPGIHIINQRKGYVVCVDASPFHRNLFLSLGAEGSVALFNILQPMNPKLELLLDDEKASDLQWSRRPMLFAVTGVNDLHVYDLTQDTCKASLKITHEDELTKLAFNPNQIGLVAVSDVTGAVHIWRLPPSMSSHEPKEMEALLALASTEESVSESKPRN